MKRVLIAPLDWGLGHATRCIPIIEKLIAKQCEVLIAGSGTSLQLLKLEFPMLTFFELPGYNPIYPTSGSMVWAMARQLPKFLRAIKQEHSTVERIVREFKIDLLISDNRYGCWSSRIPSVFITHQSNVLMPKRFGWLSKTVKKANESKMMKFDVCWIPDYPGEQSIAGELVSFGKINPHINHVFIGNLSRMKKNLDAIIQYDVVAICSGPEPQRSVLESILRKQLLISAYTFLLIRGIPSHEDERIPLGKGEVVDFLRGEGLQDVIQQAKIIIVRSGFSTIMDLQTLGKKVIFIPTPGQTEQEYLADQLMKKNIAYYSSQEDFDLERSIRLADSFSGFTPVDNKGGLLETAINEALEL
jgi:uncharacterized protein (TIGR00661 family)